MSQEKCLKEKFLELEKEKNNLLCSTSEEKEKIIRTIKETLRGITKIIESKSLKDEEFQGEGFRSKKIGYTLEELRKFNGRGGNKAYIAIGEEIYDVTNHPLWQNGVHFGLICGGDGTSEYFSCHSGDLAAKNKLKIVGVLKRVVT